MLDSTKVLLEEIYIIEPALREKEEIVVKIIAEMQQKKPEIIIDEAFKKALRAKVMNELLKKEKQPAWYIVLPFVSGLSIAAFGFFILNQYMNSPLPSLEQRHPTIQKISFQNVIEKKGEKAFGSPVLQSSSVAQTSSNASHPRVLGEKQTKEETSPSVVPGVMMATPPTTKIVAPSDAMMPYPADFPYYTYVYTGSLPETQTGFTVYKKSNSLGDKKFADGLLSSLSIDSVALSAFQNANVTNITFSEDRDYGYTVNIDFNTMSVSLSQNWEKWPTPKCDANGCETPKALEKQDSISSDELKIIGKKFLTQYGIDMNSYGEPKIQDSFPMIAYEGVKTESNDDTPSEQYTLIYPLLIDGKEIREEYGGYKGITLTIDTRTKRVTSMFGLEKQTLESSYYTGTVSSGTLHDYIRYGGKYETKALPEQKIVEVSLGTPTLQYVHVYGEWKDGISPEYYIPAYVFPVKKDTTTTGYIPEQITVPALEEFAKIIPTNIPVVSPMPLRVEKSVQ